MYSLPLSSLTEQDHPTPTPGTERPRTSLTAELLIASCLALFPAKAAADSQCWCQQRDPVIGITGPRGDDFILPPVAINRTVPGPGCTFFIRSIDLSVNGQSVDHLDGDTCIQEHCYSLTLWSVGADGDHTGTFTCTGVDSTGQPQSSNFQFEYYQDTTPPVVELSSPTAGATVGAITEISGTASDGPGVGLGPLVTPNGDVANGVVFVNVSYGPLTDPFPDPGTVTLPLISSTWNVSATGSKIPVLLC